ncbi:MAG: NYN domain-containing protein [Planctomycetes bacterium]|nr:NYN domain-containing protein [Planctomycetota bacterium]
MARTVLIDAYNLMHAVAELDFARGRFPACRRLVRRLAAWATGRNERVVVVFDGARPSELPPAGPLELRFMLDRADADLIELLERPGLHTLVSADNEIVDRARALSQTWLAPNQFWQIVQDDLAVKGEAQERERRLAPDEVDEWLEVFGDTASVKRRQAERAQAKPKPIMPPEEVADWLRYFGES